MTDWWPAIAGHECSAGWGVGREDTARDEVSRSERVHHGDTAREQWGVTEDQEGSEQIWARGELREGRPARQEALATD